MIPVICSLCYYTVQKYKKSHAIFQKFIVVSSQCLGEANFLGGVARAKGVKDFNPESAKKRFFEIYLDKVRLLRQQFVSVVD